MSSYRIASRYAKSLIDLAGEQGKLDRVVEDMTFFAEVAKLKDVALLLKSPIISGDKKGKVLDAIFSGKVDPLTHSFIEIIIRKGREAYLSEIADEVINQYRVIKGISIVEVVSAEKLTDETSKLSMHVIYESVEQRDQVLKLPFAQGINMAHNRLQDIVQKTFALK